jgi:hypothetical protein
MGTLSSEEVWCPWNDIIVCESKTNTILEWLGYPLYGTPRFTL